MSVRGPEAAKRATARVHLSSRFQGMSGAALAMCLSSLLCGAVGGLLGATEAVPASAETAIGASGAADLVELSAPGVGLPLADEPGDGPVFDSAIQTAPQEAAPQEAAPQEAAPKNAEPEEPARYEVVPGATLATALVEEGQVRLFAEAGDHEAAWELTAPTEFGGLRHFLVIGESGDWLQVQVPVRPNGTTGWILRSAVRLAPLDHRVQVDLSDRSVVVWNGDEIVLDTTSAIGRPSAPTPIGSFYIRDIFEWNPDSVYGPYVLALSSYSESIDVINGGEAVVAIHGTNAPWDLGKAVSLGCIRLDNDAVTVLAQMISPGTPIDVVP